MCNVQGRAVAISGSPRVSGVAHMRYLSLFSGIEAASAAWIPLGWECVGVAEIENFPSAVLAHHYPSVPNLGDITKITEEQIKGLGHIDLVVGGFPCQDVSVAGKRAGLLNDDGSATRSGLFFAAMRVVGWTGARWTVIENVPGLLSSKGGLDFAAVVGSLAGCEFGVPAKGWGKIGAAAGPDGMVEWCVLDAQWFGVPQRRRRVFLVRDTGDWHSRPPVLFERHSLQRHPAPSRETGKDLAPCLSARTKGGGGLGTDFDLDGGLINAPVASFWNGEQVTQTLDAVLAKGQMMPEKNRFPAVLVPDVTHSLRADGFDASEDGTGRGTPLVPTYCIKGAAVGRKPEAGPQYGEVIEDVSYTQNATEQHVVAIRAAQTSSNGCGISEDGTSYTLDGAQGQAVAFAQNTRDEVREMAVVGALAASPGMKQTSYIRSAMQVRRLTPEECELLQGFQRGYSQVPYRNKPAADGPRYKALGNSMAVPVMRWIGERIQLVDWLHS